MATFFRRVGASVHGGVDVAELACLGVQPEEIIDFSSNQSPLGASPRVAPAMAAATVDAYPDRDARPLAAAIAAHHGLTPDHVVVGNGSTELIRLVAQLALSPGDIAVALAPTFGEYQVATELTGAVYQPVPQLFGSLPTARLCWWCAPNNPTGMAPASEEIARCVRAYPGTLFVLDEAYCDLLPAPQWTPALLDAGNLLVLRSMTKAWGLAGLRLGYALGSPALMAPLRAAKPPWNVNACAQAAGIAALADTAHYAATLALLRAEKERLVSGLQALGLAVLPSDAAFFLIRVGDAPAAKRALLAHGCLVRDCTSFGLPDCIRVSPRHSEQNHILLEACARLVGEGAL